MDLGIGLLPYQSLTLRTTEFLEQYSSMVFGLSLLYLPYIYLLYLPHMLGF